MTGRNENGRSVEGWLETVSRGVNNVRNVASGRRVTTVF